MITLKEINDFLEVKAPCAYKMDFDNVGLLIGDEDNLVSKILIALEITDEVVDEAIEKGIDLIVSHHPIFFSMKSISSATPLGKRTMKMIESKIACICMHTNLDAVKGGVNDALAEIAGLKDIKPLEVSGEDKNGDYYGIGRIGTLPNKASLAEYLVFLKNALKTNGLRYHDAGRPVKLVAVGGGSCGEYLETAVKKGCDTFVSSDLKYDTFLEAKLHGVNIIDGDHYCTENVIAPVLQCWLKDEFPALEVEISAIHKQTIMFFS